MVRKVIFRIFVYTFLSIAAFLSVFPLFWMAVSATNMNVDIIRGTLLPGTYLLENLRKLSEYTDLGRAFLNSARNAVLLTVLSVLLCSLAGYGFEVFNSKAKDRFMAFLLLAMMVPFAATMIPLFQMMAEMSLLNTAVAFMLPLISTPFYIMLFRQSARSFPYEMVEAARIDGLSEVGIFFRMFMPTMKSTYAAAITIVFLNAWNQYLWPRVILMSSESITMPLLIGNLTDGYLTDNGIVMLAVLIASVPTIVIFFFLQRYFAEGILGTVK